MANVVIRRVLAVLLTLALLIVEGMFALMLLQTKLVPTKYIFVMCAILLVVDLAVLYLTWTGDRIWKMIISAVFTVIMVVGIGMVGSYVVRGVNTLDEITKVTVEIADVGVYVRADDPAQSVQDTGDYVYGILTLQDRENTDKAMKELEDTLGKTLEVVEYDGLNALIDSLITTGETQVIVLNSAFVGLLEEMEGYEEAGSQLREIHVEQVETVIEQVVPATPQQDSTEQAAGDEPVAQTEQNCFSVYISGIDSRSGLIAKSRSDVNIVATVNTETRQILLVSTPRDFYVPLTISNGVPDKLTHAGIYGVDVSRGTLEMLYETNIDYYFRVNFSGFEGIIDALGGVNVYSSQSFTSGGRQFYAGENYLDGAAALTFARERKAFASGDRQRGKNQMEVIRAVINKAVSPALLMNYNAILEEVAGSFETSVPYDLIAGLVRQQLDEGGDWNVVSYSVDGTGASKKPYSLSTNAYVMVPDYSTVEKAQSMMQMVKDGQILEG